MFTTQSSIKEQNLQNESLFLSLYIYTVVHIYYFMYMSVGFYIFIYHANTNCKPIIINFLYTYMYSYTYIHVSQSVVQLGQQLLSANGRSKDPVVSLSKRLDVYATLQYMPESWKSRL